ncbi:MAG: pyruvoyl-dependent arginine decarboxylase [Euryarchaeota archaeon]|nr:pyruvoyl-dependent arginine decarboxylase [Euryarchaeota archaeon]
MPKEDDLKELSPGEMVFCVMSRTSSNEPGKTLTSSVGCVLPRDINKHGCISQVPRLRRKCTGAE